MDDRPLARIQRFLKQMISWALQFFSGQSGPVMSQLLLDHTGKDQFNDRVWDAGTRWYTNQPACSIKSLEYLDPEEDAKLRHDSNLVIVLVEKRLLDDQISVLKQPVFDDPYASNQTHEQQHHSGEIPPSPFSPPPRAGNFNLRPALSTFRSDINATLIDPEWDPCPPNYTACVIVADVYAGELHQDGRTLLAIREFLRDVQRKYPNLRGVILVGAFPEALLSRRWGKPGAIYEDIMAYRSEIVLADLNGLWEQRYQNGGKWTDCFLIDDAKTGITRWVNGKHYPSWDPEVGFEDADGLPNPQQTGPLMKCRLFWYPFAVSEKIVDKNGNIVNIGDIVYKQGHYYSPDGTEYGPLFDLYPDDNKALNESGDKDLQNPIAYPEILVSRINSRNIARSKDHKGTYLDPYLERELLIAYFNRNHKYRVGELKHRGAAGFACSHPDEPEFSWVDLRAAFSECEADYKDIEHEPLVELWQCKNGKVKDFRRFLGHPAILRSMLMHGDFTYLQLRDRKWEFMDWRNRWDNRDVTQTPAVFYWNTTCYSSAPLYSGFKPYNAQMYGFGNPAECLLFYGDGLAVIAQTHETGVWPGKHPDPCAQPSPPGGSFERTLRAHRTFGETWRAIFEEDRNNSTLRQAEDSENDGVRKLAYVYHVIGDWTLRLNQRSFE